MLTTIISLLIALGHILHPNDFYNLSSEQQDEMIEIVIDDVPLG